MPHDRHISLIKIDVEGAGLMVLRGAKRIIEDCRPFIIFESGPGSARNHGLHESELYDFLTTYRYQIYVPRDYIAGAQPLRLDEFVDCHTYPFRAFNFVATERS